MSDFALSKAPNIPGWKEDGNSPLKVTSASGNTITLSKTYDAVMMVATSASGAPLHLQINGVTSGYKYSEDSGNFTSGANFVEIGSGATCTGNKILMSGNWTGGWGISNENVGNGSGNATSGRHDTVTSPLDTIRVFNANNNTITAEFRVFGL